LLKDVAPETLQQLCKDKHLRKIAQCLPDWRDAAPFLGLSGAEENIIEDDHKTALRLRRRIAVLRKWRQKYGKKATYERLAKAFWEMGNVALADEVSQSDRLHLFSDTFRDHQVKCVSHTPKLKPRPCHAHNHASLISGVYSNFNEHERTQKY